MKTYIFKVVSQQAVSYIPSTKQEGGQLAKSVIRLRELGSGKYGNEYAFRQSRFVQVLRK